MSSTSAPRDSSTIASQVAGALIGAAAGIAVGLVLAQRFGGAGGIAARFAGHPEDDAAPGVELGSDADWDDADDAIDGDLDDDDVDDVDDALGERVLEVFTNDPLLAERAIDIEVQPGATVELTGWVDAEREVEYAATLAGGVPGVRHVITQLGVEGKGWGPRRG